MKKFKFLIILSIAGVAVLWGSGYKINFQQPSPGWVYGNSDPCSGELMYKAAENFQAGIIDKIEYDKTVKESIEFQKKNCKDGRSRKEKKKRKKKNSRDTIPPTMVPPPIDTVADYVGFVDSNDIQFEGGTQENACPLRSLIEKNDSSGKLNIMEQHCERKNGNCHFVKDNILIMSHDLDPMHIVNPDSTLIFRLVPAIAFTDSLLNSNYIPFELENKYFKWRERKYECSKGISIPPPGFKCTNHKNPSLTGADQCGKLKSEIEKLKKIGNADCEFVVLYPSRQGNEVFELRKNKKKIIKGLDASLFHHPIKNVKFPSGFTESKNKKAMGNLLYQLAVFIANDESIEIIQAPDANGLFFTVIGSNPNGKYIYSFGYKQNGRYDSYHPIDIEESMVLSQKTTAAIWNNPNHRKLLKIMVSKWQKTGEKAKIKAVLPTSQYLNPLKVMGNPTSSDKFPPNIIPTLDKGNPIDLLIESKGKYHIVRSNGDKISTWIGKLLADHKNNWLKYLAIADPQLKVISDSKNNGLFVFLFRNSSAALWSWETKNGLPPLQQRLLWGNRTFELNPKLKVQSYIAIISNTSSKERDFWLGVALQKSKIIPLDYFNTNQDHNFLFAYSYDNIPKAFRLSRDYELNQGIQFNSVSIQTQNWKDWIDYYQNWRKEFGQYLVYSHMKKLEAWFSTHRMGISSMLNQKFLVSVFLPNRSFQNVPLHRITRKIQGDGIIYKHLRTPDKDQLFRDWLVNNWQKTGRWRANPLGYLERVLQPT